jgi:hypothetical protein
MTSLTSKSLHGCSTEVSRWNQEYNAWLRDALPHEVMAAAVARRYLGFNQIRIRGTAHLQRQELQLHEVLS